MDLSGTSARDTLRLLRTNGIPIVPATDIALDARTYEIMSVTGMEKRFATLTRGSRSPSERRLVKGIDRLLQAAGYPAAALK
jgi:hypothetical protein